MEHDEEPTVGEMISALASASSDLDRDWPVDLAADDVHDRISECHEALGEIGGALCGLQMWRSQRAQALDVLVPCPPREIKVMVTAARTLREEARALRLNSAAQRQLHQAAWEIEKSIGRHRAARKPPKPHKQRPPMSGFLDNPPNRLRELRLYAGMRQREVVDRLPPINDRTGRRPARSVLSCWERGTQPIPDHLLGPLADLYGVTVEDLLTPGPSELVIPEEWFGDQG